MLKIKWADDKAIRHFDSIKDDLLERIKSILEGSSVKVDKVTYQIDDIKGKEILNMLSTEDGLYNLITGRPDKLRKIISKIYYVQKEVFSVDNNINRVLYNVFISNTYDGVKQVKKQKISRFDKIAFAKNIGLITCPYCNRAYINTIEKDNTEKTVVKPQIDHYFPKSIYPFLGMSYYNLIPSCTVCNGFGNKEDKIPIQSNSDPDNSALIINPYEIDLSQFKFSYKILSSNYFDANSYEILLDFPSDFEENYEEFFGLSTLYKEHKDHAQELFLKKQKYSQVSQQFIRNTVDNDDIRSDFERLYYGYYSKEDDFHKRPLSKFYHDILLNDKINDTEF